MNFPLGAVRDRTVRKTIAYEICEWCRRYPRGGVNPSVCEAPSARRVPMGGPWLHSMLFPGRHERTSRSIEATCSCLDRRSSRARVPSEYTMRGVLFPIPTLHLSTWAWATRECSSLHGVVLTSTSTREYAAHGFHQGTRHPTHQVESPRTLAPFIQRRARKDRMG